MTFSNLAGIFAVTKLRLLLSASMILTWWIVHLLTENKPMIEQLVTSHVQQAKMQIPSVSVDWPKHGPRSRFNESKVALLIEPRPLPHLVSLLLHMTAVVPLDWPFTYIGSPESIAFIERSYAIRHLERTGKLDARALPSPWTLQTNEDLSRILTDMRFYDNVLPGVEWIFRYESNSVLCANAEKSLDNWLQWNWAGLGGVPNDRYSGAAGLSLRRVSAIRTILEFQERHNDTELEHDWFMKRIKVLPDELALSQAPEGISIDDTALAPMGYHMGDNTDDWKDIESRKRALSYCPEISMITDMKLERELCTDPQ